MWSDLLVFCNLWFSFCLPSDGGEGNGNPLQCSCLENPRDGGAWWAAIYGVAQSQTWLKPLSSSSSSSPLMEKIRGLRKLSDGRDWLREKLGLVLMGGAMFSTSLIQFPVDGWSCVPSLLFECEDHNKLWKSLQEMGIQDHLTCLLRNLYSGQETTVRTGHGTTDWFQIGKGVRQGCMLSPCLFNLYAEYIMRTAGLEET